MDKILNIAHRGASSLAPENTLAAARKAREVGADLWELDVAVTTDETLILCHDHSLARTTNVSDLYPKRTPWLFSSFTFDEIRSLNAGSWFVETDPFKQIAFGAVTSVELASYENEIFPTLEEALIFTQESNWCVNLELKCLPESIAYFPLVKQVLELIKRLGFKEDYLVISSYNHDWLQDVQIRNPKLNVQALIGEQETEPLDWGGLKFKTYNTNRLTSDDEIQAVTKKGISVNIYTPNEEDEMRHFIETGTAGIITDFPQRLNALLKRRNGD